MYTLQGHAAAANSAVFSPNGDFFASAADDAIVMVWRTNFDRVSPGSVTEAPVETENRAPVEERPKTAPAKSRSTAFKKSRRPSSGRPAPPVPSAPSTKAPAAAPKAPPAAPVATPSDNSQKADMEKIARTMGYIAQQLEVVTNTLGVFERRLTRNEDLIQEMAQRLKNQEL